MARPRKKRAELARDNERLAQMSMRLNERRDEIMYEGAASALRILEAHGDQYAGALLTLRTEYARRGWGVTQ